MKEFKLNRQIYIILGVVLLLAILIQTTRFETFLDVGSDPNKWSETAGGAEPSDALSAAETAKLDERKTLVLYDPEESYSVRLKDNAIHLLDYMKKSFETGDIRSYSGKGDGYLSVILTFTNLERMNDTDWIDGFVNDGGSVLFATMPEPGDTMLRIYRKLGINEWGDYLVSKGLVLTSNVLINEKGKTYSEEIIENTSFQVRLGKESEVLAESKDGLPLLWRTPYGNGVFVVFNGTMLQEKSSRGFFAGAISELKEVDIYPVINSKLMYIDDFPAPFPTGYQEDIFDLYRRDLTRFFKEVWWPDMIRLASHHGLKYTGVVIQTYENKTRGPFNADSDRYYLRTYGREILKRGGEVGIHGYNHQSYTDNPAVLEEYGYKAWASEEDMRASVRTVVDFVGKSFPDYGLHTFVPASNVLSSQGREALKEAWPEMRTISAVYNTDPEGLSYVQEIGVADDGIVELPRITSGYKEDEFNLWASANAITSVGLFSHFVHPDDILDRERSFPYNWDDLYRMTDGFLSEVDREWPWLRDMTANQGSMEVVRYTKNDPHFRYTDEGVEGYVNHYMGGEMYYYLRTDKQVGRLVNCKAYRIDDGTYLVEAYDKRFSLGLEG
ncbi:DUF2194 domain-containing protein [Cohnella thailandensis]|uniref:DUF2194 domain-containing protein n=1 Tax=Cohnella thailandensis TaxID=557557 RepID=A0A841T0V5_9BACL|nr:DUF2194 domain-containing protein [Cohnella thailandensis]MBB6634691.1 DUF2194 domain-containing protein [Cohnella thailandensis]MBP1972753.1 hypothetical protein [Cohnella thailandensis]